MARARKRTSIPEMYARRLALVRERMAKKNLPAYLLTDRMDGYYLTGFTGEDSAVLITPKVVHLISDGRFEESIKAECSWAKVSLRKGLLEPEIGSVVRGYRLPKVGIQADRMTVESQAAIRKAARPVRLVKAPPIVNDLRKFKDEIEVDILLEAIKVAQDAFKAMRRTIRVGQTEIELAARLEYEMKRRGATGPSFPTIVAEGPNAALPHAFPGQRKVKNGSAILFDWGAAYPFYCSDLTRMLFLGKVPAKMRKIYGIVKDAKDKATAAIRPGARMCDVDAVARNHIAKAGFKKYFGHGLGHGLGLYVHEAPSLSWRSQEKLKAGMVVTVEPGIYLPGVGGVRIEDDVLVTDDGARVLSSLSTELEDAVI